jgi:hypothetical protein
MSTSADLRQLAREPGIYEFVAPDIIEIISYLSDLNLVISSFDYLIDIWGPSYCMPTMLVWREYDYARDLINPCIVQLGNGEFAPVLVFGPFLDNEAQQRFHSRYACEELPMFEGRDTITLLISPFQCD